MLGRRKEKKEQDKYVRIQGEEDSTSSEHSIHSHMKLLQCSQKQIVILNQWKHFFERYEKYIIIFLDNARYQRAYETQNYANSLNIHLEFLPPYSPNLNLIERLWKFTKKKCFKNKYYEDFNTFEKTLIDFLWNLWLYKNELETLLTLNFEIIRNY